MPGHPLHGDCMPIDGKFLMIGVVPGGLMLSVARFPLSWSSYKGFSTGVVRHQLLRCMLPRFLAGIMVLAVVLLVVTRLFRLF